MAAARNQTRIRPDFVDIQETLKKQIGTQSDDDYIGAQAGASNTIVGQNVSSAPTLPIVPTSIPPGTISHAGHPVGPKIGTPTLQGPAGGAAIASYIPNLTQALKKLAVAIDDYPITLDTRLLQSSDVSTGTFVFDPSAYLSNQNILDFSLNNVINISILSPFFIPKLTENPSFIFERLLMVIKEVSPSASATSGNVAPIYQFEFIISDTGLGRFTLMPTNNNFTIRRPIRFDKSITIQFFTPATQVTSVAFPPQSVQGLKYFVTGIATTTFTNPVGAGFVVGDVLVFTTADPAVSGNPLNAAFLSPLGLTITAVIPTQVTISGAFIIAGLGAATTFTVFPASRVIRIPFNFRTARTGDGNFIVPT